ncbi:MAG: tRNA (adenosine(37)-N6)-dimethylallyltransferase MiaA, partial [Chitinophagaceae bacterium]
LSAVPHHFIASHSIHQPVNAADFEKYALDKIADIFKRAEHAVMVGGTGLYIKAFCEGLDKIPPVPKEIHEQVNKDFESNGLVWLQSEIERLDPTFFATGETENPHRLLRALEVILATGTSIRTFQSGAKADRQFDIIKLGIAPPKEILHAQINQRVDAMITAGQIEEARALHQYKDLVPLQTVGYSELFEYFEGKINQKEAIELIKVRTRQYAKRQLTWFRKDNMRWFESGAELSIN